MKLLRLLRPRALRVWWLACGVLWGCNVHVYSPPTGSFPTESSASLGREHSSVRAEVFGGGELFGPGVSSYRVGVARGLTDQLDLSLSPSLTWVHGSSGEGAHPGIYALRAGLKYAPVPHFAVVGGLGAGGSAGGGYLSPDLGFIAAYENPHLVPFFTLRGLLSAPLAARRVHFSVPDDTHGSDADSDPDRYQLTPHFTLGVQTGVGLRAPLTREGQLRVLPALACALGFTMLDDPRDRSTYFGLSCAVDAKF